jgi:hypothetical protein
VAAFFSEGLSGRFTEERREFQLSSGPFALASQTSPGDLRNPDPVQTKKESTVKNRMTFSKIILLGTLMSLVVIFGIFAPRAVAQERYGRTSLAKDVLSGGHAGDGVEAGSAITGKGSGPGPMRGVRLQKITRNKGQTEKHI